MKQDGAQALTVFVMSLKERKDERIPFNYMPKLKNHEEFSQYR